MFEPQSHPRVYGIAPGIDVAQSIVDGIVDRMRNHPPEAMARVTLILNTKRMARRVRDLFDRGEAMFLPRILLLGDLEGFLKTPLPDAMPPLRQRLELVRLISLLLDQEPDLAPRSSLYDLAESLGAVMDEMQGEGVSAEDIQTLDISDASGHWERALRFFTIVHHYTSASAEGISQDQRQRLLVQELTTLWQDTPAQHPIILAGSTGSRGATHDLMKAIAKLPQGAVVLPGYDHDLPDRVWARFDDVHDGEDHPQYRFHTLKSELGLETMAPWQRDVAPHHALANRVVSLALRPAPVTNQWLAEGPDLGDLGAAMDHITLLEAPSQRDEAMAIAMRLRQAAQDGQTAALITPDRMLTRRVTAALDRWGIVPDDSAGMPLHLSPPGRFLRHVGDLFCQPLTSEMLITLLKHPITHTGGARNIHLRLTREFELTLRQNEISHPDAAFLDQWAIKQDDAEATAWIGWIKSAFLSRTCTQNHALSALIETHITLAQTIAEGSCPNETHGLWQEAAGRKAEAVMSDLRDNAEFGGAMTYRDYMDMVAALLSRGEVRDRDAPHPRILIWGTLEARVHGADLLILGGLNEGSWPQAPSADPWLNRKMRKEAGLLSPDRRIGLSAHDFQQAIAGKEVWLARAKRNDEAETVPARWLNRITNLLLGLPNQGGSQALAEMRDRGEDWLGMVKTIEATTRIPNAPRPSPCPPVPARPRKLAVTEIERLRRDPYAIYAKHVLRLKPLPALIQTPNPGMRGTVVHKILEEFIKDVVQDPETLSVAHLLHVSETILAENVPFASTRLAWQSYMERIAPRFIYGEEQRQKRGKPIKFEGYGRITLDEIDFTLFGFADRIDRDPLGPLRIYDYKTGTLPSIKQQGEYNKQLLLEAMIAEEGGFEDVTANEVIEAVYIAISHDKKDVPALLNKYPIRDVREKLVQLISKHLELDHGFTSRRAMEHDRDQRDYDQLARFGEWDGVDMPTPQEVS